MITDKDIKKLLKVFPSRNDMKEELAALEKRVDVKFESILTSFDAIAKHMEAYHQGMAVMRHRMGRMGKWIKEASKKIGVAYKV